MNAEINLSGAYLRLRDLRPADEDAYCAIYTSPVLTRFLGVDRCSPQSAATAFLGALTQRSSPHRHRYTFAITAVGDDTMHGTIGLLLEDYGSNAMVTGLVIRPGAPVAGYGAQAARLMMAHGFGPLGLHRIWAGHRSDHVRMRELMLEAGFHPEATLRDLFHTAGRWHDVTTYAALSHQWRLTASAGERAILHSLDRPHAVPPAARRTVDRLDAVGVGAEADAVQSGTDRAPRAARF
jgi:RimJ/RimL family protein N-acetyltransferase